MNSKWGTYPWFIEHGADLIHPADLEAFKQEAIITDIMWHYDKQEHYYLISTRAKKKSKRYLESEFM